MVFSRTLKNVGWNSELINGNIAEEVRRLKAQPGRDMSVGCASLASAFMELGKSSGGFHIATTKRPGTILGLGDIMCGRNYLTSSILCVWTKPPA